MAASRTSPRSSTRRSVGGPAPCRRGGCRPARRALALRQQVRRRRRGSSRCRRPREARRRSGGSTVSPRRNGWRERQERPPPESTRVRKSSVVLRPQRVELGAISVRVAARAQRRAEGLVLGGEADTVWPRAAAPPRTRPRPPRGPSRRGASPPSGRVWEMNASPVGDRHDRPPPAPNTRRKPQASEPGLAGAQPLHRAAGPGSSRSSLERSGRAGGSGSPPGSPPSSAASPRRRGSARTGRGPRPCRAVDRHGDALVDLPAELRRAHPARG